MLKEEEDNKIPPADQETKAIFLQHQTKSSPMVYEIATMRIVWLRNLVAEDRNL